MLVDRFSFFFIAVDGYTVYMHVKIVCGNQVEVTNRERAKCMVFFLGGCNLKLHFRVYVATVNCNSRGRRGRSAVPDCT
jgi:hypothetical protein